MSIRGSGKIATKPRMIEVSVHSPMRCSSWVWLQNCLQTLIDLVSGGSEHCQLSTNSCTASGSAISSKMFVLVSQGWSNESLILKNKATIYSRLSDIEKGCNVRLN